MKTKSTDNAKKLRDMFAKMNYANFCGEFSKVIYGLEEARDMAVCCLLAGGNLLIDGSPGTAKTMFVNVIASLVDLKFTRIQLSGDQTSAEVRGFVMPVPNMTFKFHEQTSSNRPLSDTQKKENKDTANDMLDSIAQTAGDEIKTYQSVGPLKGAQIVLLDEISRWNFEAVNALFSALQERFFKLGDTEHPLDPLITFYLTRNVFDIKGVKPLSLAFLDRQTCSVMIDRVSFEDEMKIACQPKEVDLKTTVNPVWGKQDILAIRELVTKSPFLDINNNKAIVSYATRLNRATDPYLPENAVFMKDRGIRKERMVYAGASSRALKTFMGLAVVYVHCILGEDTIYPEHIKSLAHMVLRHRLSFKVATEPESLKAAQVLVDEIINKVPILEGRK